MKLLRTIRLDVSDTFIFEQAAEPGEWAVSGAFMFSDTDPAALEGKARVALRSGFLGIQSLGWSTLVQVVDATEADRSTATAMLAQHFMERFGAPDYASAHAAAEEELTFAASLCEHPRDTLIAVHRTYEDGDIRETFRSLKSRAGPKPLRAFSFLEVEDQDEIPAEEVDLVTLAEGERK